MREDTTSLLQFIIDVHAIFLFVLEGKKSKTNNQTKLLT